MYAFRINLVPCIFVFLSVLGCIAILISSAQFEENSVGFQYKFFSSQVLMVLMATLLAYALYNSSYLQLRNIFISIFFISSLIIFLGHFVGNFVNLSVLVGNVAINPLIFFYPSFAFITSWLIFSFKKVGNGKIGLIMVSVLGSVFTLFFFLMKDMNSALIVFFTFSLQVVWVRASLPSFFLLLASVAFVAVIVSLFFPSATEWLLDFLGTSKEVATGASLGKSQFLNIGSELGQMKYIVSDPYGGFFLSVMNEDIGWSFSLLVLSILTVFICHLIVLTLKLQEEKSNMLLGIIIQMSLQVMLSFGVSLHFLPMEYTILPFFSHNMSNIIAGGLVVGFIWKLSQLKRGKSLWDN